VSNLTTPAGAGIRSSSLNTDSIAESENRTTPVDITLENHTHVTPVKSD